MKTLLEFLVKGNITKIDDSFFGVTYKQLKDNINESIEINEHLYIVTFYPIMEEKYIKYSFKLLNDIFENINIQELSKEISIQLQIDTLKKLSIFFISGKKQFVIIKENDSDKLKLWDNTKGDWVYGDVIENIINYIKE